MDVKNEIIQSEDFFINVLNTLNPMGHYSSNNNNAQACPCHNGKGGSDSFSWHEEGNVWKGKCFSCGIGGDIIDIYAQAKGLDVKDPGDFKQALNELANILNIIEDTDKPLVKKEKVSNKKTEKIFTDQDIEILTEKAHKNVGKTDYFKNRGFTNDTIETYNLGYTPSYKIKGFDNGPAAIVPYPNENYFFTRIIKPKGKLKKIFMTGKALPLFNKDVINDNDIIFVTEGQFDCLSILQIGFPSIGTNSVSGSNQLIKYLVDNEIKDKVFIVAYDADAAGDKGAEKLISLLEGEGFKAIRYRPSVGKDVNEMLVKCKDQLLEDLVNIYGEAEGLLEPLVCVETESSIDGHKIMVDISGDDLIPNIPENFVDVDYEDVNDNTPIKKEIVSAVQESAKVEIVEEQEVEKFEEQQVEQPKEEVEEEPKEEPKEEPNNYNYGQYIFNGKYIYYEKTDKDGEVVETIIIYNGSLDIVSSNTDIDTNEETLVLRSKMFGKEAETSIKKGLLSKSSFAEEINNQKGFLIFPRNGLDVRDYIATQYRCLLASNTLVEKLVTDKIGWIKYNSKTTFIYPRPDLSIDGKIYHNKNTTISEKFKSKGDSEKYIDNVLYPLLATKIGVIAISATIGSLLLEKLNAHESFILDIYGKNGKGKTILLFALGSIFGNPRDYTLEWNSTKTAIISNASDLNNFPLMLDDTKKCTNKEMIAEVVYSLSGGKDKARANQDGSSREQKTFKNITISTGETSLLNYLEGESSGAGAYGRVISIDTDQYEIFSSKQEADTLINYCTKNYGHFGFEFCKWMFTFLEDKDNLGSLNSKYINYMNMYCDLVEHHTSIRKAKHIALLHVACDLLINFLNMSYKKIEIDANDIFIDLLEVSEKNSREQDIYLNAYEDVVEHCHMLQDRIHIESRDGSIPPDRVVGWFKDNIFYIFDKKLVKDILEDHGDFNDILKEWRLRGYLVTDTGKLQKTVRTPYKTDGKTRSIKTYAIDTRCYNKTNKIEDENFKLIK